MSFADNRDFKGVWIPKELWLDKNITKMELLLLTEIDSLDSSDRGCFASNAKLGSFLNVSASRASQLVSSLESKGYITCENIYEGKQVKRRTIKVVNKLSRGTKFIKRGYLENCEESNTYSNNTKDTTVVDSILIYLNEKTGKNFRLLDSNRKLISSRINDGYSTDDCKRVIDTKCQEWMGNLDMEKHLNPITLFRPSNFDKYLNESPIIMKQKGTSYEQF